MFPFRVEIFGDRGAAIFFWLEIFLELGYVEFFLVGLPKISNTIGWTFFVTGCGDCFLEGDRVHRLVGDFLGDRLEIGFGEIGWRLDVWRLEVWGLDARGRGGANGAEIGLRREAIAGWLEMTF